MNPASHGILCVTFAANEHCGQLEHGLCIVLRIIVVQSCNQILDHHFVQVRLQARGTREPNHSMYLWRSILISSHARKPGTWVRPWLPADWAHNRTGQWWLTVPNEAQFNDAAVIKHLFKKYMLVFSSTLFLEGGDTYSSLYTVLSLDRAYEH